MEKTFYTKINLLPHIQKLVKRYNGRFKFNPMKLGEEALIVLTFDNIQKSNKFNTILRIIESKYF